MTVCCAQAMVALLLPTNFLYAFLYYTDVGAVTFILASYLVSVPCLPTSLPPWMEDSEKSLRC